VTESIDRHLDLDVAVLVEPLLEVQGIVAERGLGLAAADLEHRFELTRGARHAHALAAAPGAGLDQHRIADALGLAQRMQVVAQHPVRSRDRRQPVRAQQLAGAGLAGEALKDAGRRTDERDVVGGHHLGEALVLRQEAVARMDRVATGDERSGDDGRSGQIRAAGVRRADADGLVGQLDGERLAVRLAVGDHRFDPEGAARPQDAQGDLPAVGDEHLLEHQAPDPLVEGSTPAMGDPPTTSMTSSG
jgi:hypothetical protein